MVGRMLIWLMDLDVHHALTLAKDKGYTNIINILQQAGGKIMSDKQFIQQAISACHKECESWWASLWRGDRENGQVIAHAVNQITATNDQLHMQNY